MSRNQHWRQFIVCFVGSSLLASLTGCVQSVPPRKADAYERLEYALKQKNNPIMADPSGFPEADNTSTARLSDFTAVEIKPATLGLRHQNHKGNQESARLITTLIERDLKTLFSNVRILEKGQEFSSSRNRILQISPHIGNIRLISGGARFWAGPMAGGSDIDVQVTYRDSSTGKIIATPRFSAGANAWGGSFTMGATDKMIRDNIVSQILDFTKENM